MATRGVRGVGVKVPIPADQRQYYLNDYTIANLHGRGRGKKAAKPKRIHGRGRHPDPWRHKGQGTGQ